MAQRRAERDAAAEADDADLARVLVQQQRQVREQLLRQHVAADSRRPPCRRSPATVVPVSRLTETVAARAFR